MFAQAHAKDLVARLESIMNEKSVLFRRMVLQNRGKPDVYENYEPEITPFLDITPRIKVQYNEIVWEAGAVQQGITFVMSGSLMMMRGDRIVKVVDQGQFVGVAEHILDLPSQYTVKARSKDGALVVRIAASLLLSRLRIDPLFAVRFYQVMCRQAATELYVRLIANYPMAVFAHAVEVDTPPGFIPVADDNAEQEGEDDKEKVETVYVKDMKMVKLLKLRRSVFLEHIDDTGILMLAGGMGIMKLSRGSILMRQGDKVQDSAIDSMYLVKSGLLNVMVGGTEEEHIVRVMGKGDIVGERALLLQEDRSATVQAKTPVTLGVIRIDQVQELIARDPSLVKILKSIFKGSAIMGINAKKDTNKDTHTNQHPDADGDKKVTMGAMTETTLFSSSQSRLSLDVNQPPPPPTPPGARASAAHALPSSNTASATTAGKGAERFILIYDSPADSLTSTPRNRAREEAYGLESVESSRSEWLGGASEQRLAELAQLGNALGIAPPFLEQYAGVGGGSQAAGFAGGSQSHAASGSLHTCTTTSATAASTGVSNGLGSHHVSRPAYPHLSHQAPAALYPFQEEEDQF